MGEWVCVCVCECVSECGSLLSVYQHTHLSNKNDLNRMG